MIALLTYSASDPAFSTSGSRLEAVHNKAGTIGAWAADFGLFVFGYSVWWLLLVGVRTGSERGPVDPSQPTTRSTRPTDALDVLGRAGHADLRQQLARMDQALPVGNAAARRQAGGVLGAVAGLDQPTRPRISRIRCAVDCDRRRRLVAGIPVLLVATG